MIFIFDVIGTVFVLLKVVRVVYHLYYHLCHRFYLEDHSCHHLTGCVRVPFVTLPVFKDKALTSVY